MEQPAMARAEPNTRLERAETEGRRRIEQFCSGRLESHTPKNGRKAMELKDAKLLRDRAYIAGEWAPADSEVFFPVRNPATGEIIVSVPDMGAAETRRAIAAADTAWPAWRAQTAKQRAVVMRRWFDLMVANADDL